MYLSVYLQPTRVKERKTTCLFILLPHPLSLPNQLLSLLRQNLLSLRSTLDANTPQSQTLPATSTSYPILSDDLPIALHKGICQCAHPISSFCSYDHLSPHSCSFIASSDSISLPNKESKALADLGWHRAMIEEMDVLTNHGTWDLVRLPTGKKVIGCR